MPRTGVDDTAVYEPHKIREPRKKSNKIGRLLILSASYGAGHDQAAKAVREAVLALDNSAEVEIVDYLGTVHPTLDAFVKYCYLKSVQYAPALYGLFYRSTSQIPPSSLVQRQLNSIGMAALDEILCTKQPDVVLSTFPTPAGVLSSLRAQGRTTVPTATVVTDHAVHSQWVHPETDLYFVGSSYVKRGLIRRGIAPHRIYVTGIPVRPAFKGLSRSRDIGVTGTIRRQYGLLPDVPVVLVMGGAYGVLSDISEVCERLFHSTVPVQTLVVTGHNDGLREQLLQQAKGATNPAVVLGYVQEVHQLMQMADLTVTKAGGLTISEAMAAELPMVIYRPIPGQEVQNTRFLLQRGVARLGHRPEEVVDLVQHLLTAPAELEFMRTQMRPIRRLHAATDIAKRLIDLAHVGYPKEHFKYVSEEG